jgi:hypothetical protein
MRLPMGSCPGHISFAIVSLIKATKGVVAVSCSVSARPSQ